jgi:hypothetical protein
VVKDIKIRFEKINSERGVAGGEGAYWRGLKEHRSLLEALG